MQFWPKNLGENANFWGVPPKSSLDKSLNELGPVAYLGFQKGGATRPP